MIGALENMEQFYSSAGTTCKIWNKLKLANSAYDTALTLQFLNGRWFKHFCVDDLFPLLEKMAYFVLYEIGIAKVIFTP